MCVHLHDLIKGTWKQWSS